MPGLRNVTACLPGLDKLIPADICAQQETVQVLIVFGLALSVSVTIYGLVNLYKFFRGDLFEQ